MAELGPERVPAPAPAAAACGSSSSADAASSPAAAPAAESPSRTRRPGSKPWDDVERWDTASQASEALPEKRVKRADFTRILQMESNHVMATAGRAEHEARAVQLKEQREAFRKRGELLRQQRSQAQKAILASIESKRREALASGDAVRRQHDALREKRQANEGRHRKAGQELNVARDAQLERAKKERAEFEARRKAEADKLKAERKRQNSETEARVKAQVTASAGRVKAQQHFDTEAKQEYFQKRLGMADDVRRHARKLKAEREGHERSYLTAASDKKERMGTASEQALARIRSSNAAKATLMKAEEREMQQRIEASKKDHKLTRRTHHNLCKSDTFTPEEKVKEVVGEEPLDLSEKFTRFFGFRKRGSGQEMSSVTL